MASWKEAAVSAAMLALAAAVAAGLIAREGPAPAADVARGSEEAFGRGLHRRELPPGGPPQRWSTPTAVFSFRDLPTGPASLSVDLREVRGPATVVADGVVVGRVGSASGPAAGTFALPDTGRRTREIELRPEAFRASDGRMLGVRLGRVAIETTRRPLLPAPMVVLELLAPALLALLGATLAGMAAGPALATALALLAVQTAMLWPSGLVHSSYAPRLAALLATGALLALAFARVVASRRPEAGAAALVALLAGWVVQVAAGLSPLMVVSDAVFHAHKLAAVAAGDLFPLSVTQHARPFRFPYGVSFYALLAPLARAGLDTVALVRWGAAVAGLAATAAVFLLALVARGARAAAVAAVLLQFLPATFDVAYSYGNFSNAFGQSATVLFFCWWAGRAPGGWPVGSALLALAALAHFSSFVCVLALVAALVMVEVRRGEGDRTRVMAALVGLALAAVYYARFAGLIWEQLPRLAEGGGQGRGASRSAWDAARLQAQGVLGQWGLPALALAWIGRPRPRAGDRFDRDLAAYWIAMLVLAVPAILSPLEVRYLYALTGAVALSAGVGALGWDEAGGARRTLARVLLAAQMALGARAIAEAIVARYRP